MEHGYLNLRWFSLLSFHATLLLYTLARSESAAAPLSGNETDRLALLAFKDKITQDPLGIMSSWNRSLHHCDWMGVTCSPSNGRVVIFNLEAQRLVGYISPAIWNLTFLTGINLLNNSFHGEIPQEVGRLVHLQHLNLSVNHFTGKIPSNLTHCSRLRVISLSYNQLTGSIPDQLDSLSKLIFLSLAQNSLTGTIPAWIGNLSHLTYIVLGRNGLHGGIPSELGKLSRLIFFTIYGNNLSGTIPPSLYNLSSLYYFSVTQNQLHGHLPPNVGLTLPNLQVFAGGVNSFTGSIPASLSNASRLEILDFAENGLTGSVPVSFGNLYHLTRLNFEKNRLGNGGLEDLNFLRFLANCTELEVLGLDYNRLGGELPSSIANLSTHLKILVIGGNLIHGSLPPGIKNLVSLTNLGIEGNFFTGRIPESIGKLQNLRRCNLNTNGFTGPIPSSFGNLTLLTVLFMEINSLEGSIPRSLGNCHSLLVMNLSYNKLNNTIPKEVVGLSSLSISLNMAHNSLTGSLPIEVGNLKNLKELDVSENKLTGEIPSTLGNCLSMEILHMEGNFFHGRIPQSLSTLRGIQDLDLSHNNLSGLIPENLGILPLINLNLSFNDLEGEVSRKGIFTNASAVSILGNNKLCGGVSKLNLPACSRQNPHTGKRSAPRTIIIVAAAVLFIVLVLCSLAVSCWMKKTRKRNAKSSPQDWKSILSYRDIFKSTNGFSEDNLIGAGSFGSVYKGISSYTESIIAVKVLNLQQQGASKSFIAECEALRNIRHRNLVKIKDICSGIDSKGNDFKALVFDYMSNGSLDKWLHPTADEHQFKSLKLVQRLNIAIEVASAMVYLHHDCPTPIIHCDLKPSNILLDEDMTARVSDFGLARFLFEASNSSFKNQSISVGLKGSIGYIPPEYGTGGHMSILGDVYSYGILLLEMFTGKRATDAMFHNGQGFCDFISMSMPEQVLEITDPRLLSEDHEAQDDGAEERIDEISFIEEENHTNDTRNRTTECLISVIKIGLACSSTSPKERMRMDDVANELQAIRDSFLMTRFGTRRTLYGATVNQ